MPSDKHKQPPSPRMQVALAVSGIGDKIGTASFERAIQCLEEGLLRYQSNMSDAQIRDGLIQRFEFTYELGHKILKRYLKCISANPQQIEEMMFQSLIHTANKQELLLGNWTDWQYFRKMRAKTSHTYNEDAAIEVVQCIPRFLEEAIYLRDKLRERLK